MAQNEEKVPTFDISEEAQEKGKAAVESAFGELTRHDVRRIGSDLAEFNKHRQEMRRRMENGARRTSRRIV
jgi:hypothetical protein